jgi:dihydrofolate reductase
MRVSLIVAMDRNGLIGDERGLPWRLSRDLRRFRALTWGKPIIMGRATHEHIGRPLPGRHNIVLSRNRGRVFAGCTVATSLEEALHVAVGDGEEVFIIGGGEVYQEALPHTNRIYLTIIDGVFAGTTHFPCELMLPAQWTLCQREIYEGDAENQHRHLFVVLERRHPGNPTLPAFDLRATLAEPFHDPAA